MDIPGNRCVMIVEDNEEEAAYLKKRFAASSQYSVIILKSGVEGINYLQGEREFANKAKFPPPAIVLVDLQLRTDDGLQLLTWIAQNEHFQPLRIVISDPADILTLIQARELGALSFLSKPFREDELLEIMKLCQIYSELKTYRERRKHFSAVREPAGTKHFLLHSESVIFTDDLQLAAN